MSQIEKNTHTAEKTAAGEASVRQRVSGILVHPTSFPSPYGIGDLGQGAYDFIDLLKETSQHIWQVLPLGPTGFGDSPYQGPSAFAGQPLIISPQKLLEKGLLSKEDLQDIPSWDPHRIDYGQAITYKNALLRKAFANFPHTPDKTMLEDYELFCRTEKDWLDDYCLFMAGKDEHEGRCWLEWEDDLRDLTDASRKKWEAKLKDQIEYYRFVQYLFQSQWMELREYAHQNDVKIIGDVPMFVALDSADVWANRKYFQLDSKGYPLCVAGVPPDYFSETGQLWGNPLYDWDYMKKTGYSWWIERMKRQLKMVDYLRIDHFRGFESYWSVPAEEETAMNGEWVKGPREDLFTAMQKEIGANLPIIAEDLGVITPEVEQLRDHFSFPGMKVLQFGFGDMNDHNYIPHFYTSVNCICYTGTHDNDTTKGWYMVQEEAVKDRIRRYGNTDGSCVSLDFIRFAFSSIACIAIFPIQDLLLLGSEGRMNVPGVAASNWSFRYTQDQIQDWQIDWLKKTTALYGRD